jgi:ubiquinone/menaquinone biosynthesis C-methylase UbiE
MLNDTFDAVLHWRRRLVEDVTGHVLEIGVGSGSNLGYYRRAAQVWAIEPDAARAEAARKAGVQASVPVEVRVAPAEALPFEDNFFDNVVSSLVFCSVSHPEQALAEIERVLRPGGTLHMLEHVRPGFAPFALVAALVTPAWSQFAANCHLDRPTVELLKQQGWKVKIHRRLSVFVRLSATKP